MGWFRKFVNELFNQEFLDVHVEAQGTDEGEKLQIIPFFLRHIGETMHGAVVGSCNVFLHGVDPGLFKLADLFIDGGHADLFAGVKIFLRNRSEQCFDILNGQDILKIVDEDQRKDVFLGIFLLHRRRKKVVLSVVVDHSLDRKSVV